MQRAIGITRVSVTAGREGDTFHSPAIQRERIRAACEVEGFELVTVHEELDVSGGRPLAERPGLRAAVEAVEAGEAEVVVAAYMDRLTRSMKVREEVIERVEAVGGTVLAVDMGVQSNATATSWLTGTLGSAVSEYIRRTAAERSAVAQQRAIDRGIPPWPSVTPGYLRDVVGERPNGARLMGPLYPDPDTAPIVRQAFEARARGATVESIRTFLADHGIRRSYHGVQALLKSRVVLGELHFGSYEPNLAAHEPIVDRDTWTAAQAVVVPRGRSPQSDRLLSRQGVLYCASCGARMVVGIQTQGGRRYRFYRCPTPISDCPKRVTIGADIAERAIVDAVIDRYGDVSGSASAAQDAADADASLHQAQVTLDSAIRSLAGFEDEQAARDQLTELRAVRDQARDRADHLGSLSTSLVLTLADDWPRLSLDAQRAILAATGVVGVVRPGRGTDRMRIDFTRQ